MLEALVSPSHWAAVGITLLVVSLTVGLHYEVLQRLSRRANSWYAIQPRLRILVLIVSILILHVVEIWLFGVGLYSINFYPNLGSVTGAESFNLLEAVYLSATTYSTVGYGDLIPHGPIRFLLGMEALVGLVMITWSASFTYLEMQRFWKN